MLLFKPDNPTTNPDARFRTAIEASLDAIYLLEALRDPVSRDILDFVFVDLNQKGAELVSLSREEMIGQRLCELLPINRSGGFFEKYKQVVETQTSLEEEFPISGQPGLVANWLHLMLERLGYRPDIVANRLEAIQALHLRPYDLVLMDMQMPEMDGLSATQRIRAELPPEHQPRIVALTANVLSESRAEAAAAGVDDYLTKPLERAPLLRVLQGSVPAPSPWLLSAGSADLSAEKALEPAIDALTLDALKAVIGEADQAILQEMIGTYLQDGQTQLGSLQAALTQRDPQALFQLAHRFKGSSSTFGAKGLAQLCQQLEAPTREDPIDWNLLQVVLSESVAEYKQVAVSLSAEAQDLHGSAACPPTSYADT